MVIFNHIWKILGSNVIVALVKKAFQNILKHKWFCISGSLNLYWCKTECSRFMKSEIEDYKLKKKRRLQIAKCGCYVPINLFLQALVFEFHIILMT